MDAGAGTGLTSVRTYEKGAVIVRERDPANEAMYVLLQGSVGVYKNYNAPGEVLLSTLLPGQYSGEMTFFIQRPRSVTLVALTEATMMEVNRLNYQELFAVQPKIAYTMMENLCKKLEQANREYEELFARIKAGGISGDTLSAGNRLFPEGHGTCLLPVEKTSPEFIYEDTFTCPLCGQTFKNLIVLTSRLITDHVDSELRQHYAGVEPMYFDVVSCPSCLYSAPAELFPETTPRLADRVKATLEPYKKGVIIREGAGRDAFTIFAGYYLALKCAPICFSEYQKITARLWHKLSRLYHDCGNQALEQYAAEHALEDYLYAYSRFEMWGKQLQQVSFVIGDLYYNRKNDAKKAKEFFETAAAIYDGSATVRKQAEQYYQQILAAEKEQQDQGGA